MMQQRSLSMRDVAGRSMPMAVRGKSASSPRRERRRGRARTVFREAARAALREAARAVLERKGYAQATLRDIVDESDITHPTFYKYFGSKEEVLADLIDGLVDALVDAASPFRSSEAAERAGGSDPSVRGRWRLGLRAVLAVARENRQLLLAVRQAIHASELHARHWEEFRARARAMFAHDIAWAERAGLIPNGDLDVLSVAMVATMEATLFELAARDDRDVERIERVIDAFFWNAVFGGHGGPVDYAVVPGKGPRAVFAAGRPRARRS
jgi:AcrR family transcriptional regulator